MKNSSRGKKFTAFIAAVLIYLFLDPYFMWRLHNSTPLYGLLEVAFLFLFLPNSDIKSKGRRGVFVLFTFLLLLSTFYEDLNIFGFIGHLCLLFIPFAKEKFANKTYDYFLTIYSVTIGLSGIVWILSFLGVVNPIGIISPLNELKTYNYNVYPLLVRPDTFYFLERFCGLFDEPGVVGTISALILVIGQFNLKDYRLLIVFITGILSMSFFYYAIVLVYYSIYTVTVSKDKRTGFLLLAILAILIILSWDNELLSDRLWSRFIWDEDAGSFAGDNRAQESAQKLFDKVKGTSTILFGMGKTKEFIHATAGSASILNEIVQKGVLFVFAYCLVFFIYGWNYKNNKITYLLYLFAFMACIYQRPYLFQAEYLFLFSMMAMSCGDMVTSNKTKETKVTRTKTVSA